MSEISTRPYLIRAIYEWCVDSNLTPYLTVQVDQNTRVPPAYIKDGQITLNLNPSAVRHLQMQNDFITFSSRFNGAAFDLVIPTNAVIGIFARENGQGLMFPAEEMPEPPAPADTPPEKPSSTRPKLSIVK